MPEVPPQIPAAARRLAAELADIRAEINRLKAGTRAPQLRQSALDGGALIVKDRAGTPLARLGMQHDGRAAIVYARGDPPPTPTAPVVVERQLALAVYWDGTFAGGAERPTDLARVDVHSSETAVYTPDGTTLVGSLVGEGAVSFAGDNDPKYIRLVAVTTSDVASDPTAAVSATPLPADQLAAGSVTAAQLAADMILTSRIRMQDTAGVTTVDLDGATGSAMIAGEYKTRDSGERIVINDANAFYRRISFYPTSGSRPAVVQAATQVQDAVDHGIIEMRAADPSNGSHETTRLDLRMQQLFLGYGHLNVTDGAGNITDPAYWSGQVYIDPDTAYLRAGIPVIFSDINMGTFGVNRIDFRHMDSAGNFISSARLEHLPIDTDQHTFLRGSNVGLGFNTNGKLQVVNFGNTAFAAIQASAFETVSAADRKRNIRDLPAPAVDVVRNAPAKQWEYIPTPAYVERVPRPDGDSDNRNPDDKWETIEIPPEVPVPHVGPMAEDLPPWLVTDNGDAVDVRDMVGVLWKAVEEIGQRLDTLEARRA